MSLTNEQHAILLKGINGTRIARRKGGGGKQLSYLEAWDVKAHLTRIFGFCNWSGEVLDATIAFEDEPTDKSRNWHVGYKVTYMLTICDQHGDEMCRYTEAAVGSASLPQRGEAHDMAIKTAESDALKRAAIALGDQFGLSLYNNGSTAPVVQLTVVHPDGYEHTAPTTPVEAPVAPVTPIRDLKTVEELEALVDLLRPLETEPDAEKRILSIAKIKAGNSELLDMELSIIGGDQITASRYCDLIAAGHFLGDTNDQ